MTATTATTPITEGTEWESRYVGEGEVYLPVIRAHFASTDHTPEVLVRSHGPRNAMTRCCPMCQMNKDGNVRGSMIAYRDWVQAALTA